MRTQAWDEMIGLRSLVATIRRNRRVWLATGLLGLIVGQASHWCSPTSTRP